MALTRKVIGRAGVAVVAAIVAVASPALAQKTAYVSSEEILSRLTEVKDARAKLAELQSTWMREIQTMEADISRQRAEIEANRLLWSPQERREADAKLKDLETKLTKFRASKYDNGGEYEKMHGEIIAPLYERVFAAISDEAKAQKYDFVFDKSTRGMPMLYANPEFDLTAAVLRRLGVKIDASELLPDADPAPEDGASPRRGRGRPTDDPNSVLNGGSEPVDSSTK